KIIIGALIQRHQLGALAQWIESQTSNLSVGGSSPSRLTKKMHSFWGAFFYVKKREGFEAGRASSAKHQKRKQH
ncbi:MAG: hypothetical protein K0R19_2872, partial [Bacillota bacterium]|nr:hypothetical protein [Bacillota bacterium]